VQQNHFAWPIGVWWAGWLALVALIALVIARTLDPVAWYYGSAPVFSASMEFLRPFLEIPGGPAAFAAAWIGQSAYDAWFGAMTLALLMATVGVTGWLLTREHGPITWTWVLPPGAVLFGFSRYVPGAFELGLVLLLIHLALLVWQTATRNDRWGGLARWALAGVLFYVAGPLPCLSYLLAAALRLESIGGATVPARITTLAPLIAWMAAVWWSGGVDPVGLSQRLGTRGATVTAMIAVFWLALCWTGQLGLQLVTRRRPALLPGRASWLAAVCALVMLGACVVSVDQTQRALLRVQSRAERQDWTGVLAAGRALENPPPEVRLQINRALYHQGRLLDELFSFPQRRGAELFPSLLDGLAVSLPLYDTLLELGHVNLAEHYVHEAIEFRGERPEILWRLAWINLVKDRSEAARVFLNRLSWVPFHRDIAERWLRAIDKDQTLAQEPNITTARQRRVTVDAVERRFSVQELLTQAIQTSHGDPMPAQYLMANYLLTDQPQGVVRNLGQLGISPKLPRHVAEAVLAVQAHGGGSVDLAGRSIDADTIARFNRFTTLATRGAQDPNVAAALQNELGDTWWFYELFGRTSGKELKR
jgi:hypothetical protein